MKKIVYLSFALTLIFIVACTKHDTTAPVITLKGSNPDVVVFGRSATYTDPGASVIDDFEGSMNYAITAGSVDMFSAGKYSLTYTATDLSDNTSTEIRYIYVDAASYLSGKFSIQNYIINVYDTTYADTISATDTNGITFKHFAAYQKAIVTGTIAGTTITIPPQTVLCGSPAQNRTFSGNGTFTSDSIFTVNYTVQDTTTVISGYGNFVRNH